FRRFRARREEELRETPRRRLPETLGVRAIRARELGLAERLERRAAREKALPPLVRRPPLGRGPGVLDRTREEQLLEVLVEKARCDARGDVLRLGPRGRLHVGGEIVVLDGTVADERDDGRPLRGARAATRAGREREDESADERGGASSHAIAGTPE